VELSPAPPSKCKLEPHAPTHGLALSPDGRQLWVTSLGDDRGLRIFRGSGSDDCSIIDTRTRRKAARVNVGHGPKRLLVARVPAA